ncbi:hypothetical protein SAMN04488542_13211 [Fontibacillus panacisegetis]|uniref:HEAT repeat-containing protein n=1 Tax=Fontibacillus panacisegetis TaxID=670482 RepID=A0A1G7STF3_9BACL|nr:hypothetical protein [Fontibacillus panacisegetis]SDG26406.1 hypothetical protein SAMN04488542_13211 [Fontibacillus panacisegetis]
MIEKLACSLGRNDEEPNIELATLLCKNRDTEGIREIVDGLNGKDKAIANDCIKVLYEIGNNQPELIANYVSDFISHLRSKNNRLAWGSMTALATITDLKPSEVYEKLDAVRTAYETGSVITIDNSMTVFSKLCKADQRYEKEIFPLLIQHLSNCRPKEVPQHAERIAICLNTANIKEFADVLEARKGDLIASQLRRIEKLMHKVKDLKEMN